MFDPSTITIDQVSSTLRNFTVVGVLLAASWKSRGIYEMAKDFLERLKTHMDRMEEGMQTLLSNHLTHIELDLKHMANHQVRATEAQQASYMTDDGAGEL